MSDYDYINRNNGENKEPQGFTYSDGSYYGQNGGYNYGGYGYGASNDPAGNNAQPSQEPPQKKKGKGAFVGIVAAVAAAGAIAGSLVTGFVALPMIAQQAQPTAQVISSEEGSAVTLPQEEPSSDASGSSGGTYGDSNPVPAIAEKAKESVVSIVMYEKTLVPGQEPVEQKISSGSGFVIKDDYILTNAHVVSSGNLIKIVTSAGDEYVAELVGKDNATELAVLKVDGLNLPAVTIGDSDSVKTGELVIAIGNPVNSDRLQNTVTVGYLSAESREVLLNGEEMNMLQTDAAINPGNSGGPLLNDKGEVIGINTMKTIFAGVDSYGNTISAEGIGFAIPITSAMDIVDVLIEDGGIVKPGIGFTYSSISAEDAELWQTPTGILIAEVNPGSPAQEAGLKPNDIITEIDGVDLTDGAEVPVFSDRAVGDTISATVWREGKEYSVEFVLADLNKLQG